MDNGQNAHQAKKDSSDLAFNLHFEKNVSLNGLSNTDRLLSEVDTDGDLTPAENVLFSQMHQNQTEFDLNPTRNRS
jgi:hypothetical protein